MKKGKKSSKSISSYFKDFVSTLSSLVAYLLLLIVALYFATDYTMNTTAPQFVEFIGITKANAAYIHHQLTVPFCVCMVIFILPSLMKK